MFRRLHCDWEKLLYIEGEEAKMKFERLGCFKYSHEENTSAYDLEDDVSDKIKNKRLSEIMEAQRLISFNFNQKLIGRKLKCIIELFTIASFQKNSLKS